MEMIVAVMKVPVLEVSEKIMKEEAVQAVLVEERESTFKTKTKDQTAVAMTTEVEVLAIPGQITEAKADLQVAHLATEIKETSVEKSALKTDVMITEQVVLAVETTEVSMEIRDQIAVAMLNEREVLEIPDQIAEAKADHQVVHSEAETTEVSMVTKGQQETLATDQTQEETTIAQADSETKTIEAATDPTGVDLPNVKAMIEEVVADLQAVASADATMTIAQAIEKDRVEIAHQEADLTNVMAKAVQVAKDQITLAKEDHLTVARAKEVDLSIVKTMTIDATHAEIANLHLVPNDLMASQIISRASAPALVAMRAKAEPYRQIMN